MKSIRPILFTAGAVAVAVAGLASFTGALGADRNSNAPRSFADDPSRVARGQYIVHQVGMCIDCHSPRADNGEFIDTKHLTGSPLPFASTVPMPWMPVAPRIAGLPSGFTEEDTVHFLMTGKRPNGRPDPLPPMPPYRLDRADAEAVTAYLRSLGSVFN
jgi:mono/diheme cytochrome c family protein